MSGRGFSILISVSCWNMNVFLSVNALHIKQQRLTEIITADRRRADALSLSFETARAARQSISAGEADESYK